MYWLLAACGPVSIGVIPDGIDTSSDSGGAAGVDPTACQALGKQGCIDPSTNEPVDGCEQLFGYALLDDHDGGLCVDVVHRPEYVGCTEAGATCDGRDHWARENDKADCHWFPADLTGGCIPYGWEACPSDSRIDDPCPTR